MSFKYKHLAVGGTFDLLHKGHEALLQKAFKNSKLVTIGLTTNKFTDQNNKKNIENQFLRRKNISKFLNQNKYLKRAKIIWLNDLYGSTLQDKTIEGLVVSPETITSAELINQERKKIGLAKLKIIRCSWIKGSKGKIISSTRIRSGEITAEGKFYRDLLLTISGKQLNEKTRQQLKKPFGRILKTLSLSALRNQTELKTDIITVGDITTAKFLSVKLEPKLAVVDFFVERKPRFSNLNQLGFSARNPDLSVKNKPGQISRQLILAIEKGIKNPNPQIIFVDGEEDLAVIPTILLSPLGTQVFYGQPHKGLVQVAISLETKNKLCEILFS